ncbi:MAG: metallophosphoesterase family protein [Promethearchaeota archaeon]
MSKFQLDLNKGDFPIIIKPNLGQPLLLNLNDFKKEEGKYFKNITFETIIIAISNQTIQDIGKSFHLNTFIQPILRDRGKFLERRGEKYSLKLTEITKLNKNVNENNLLKEENCILFDLKHTILKEEEILGERRDLFKIVFQIDEIKKIEALFKDSMRNFLLFDIIHRIPNRDEEVINFHSLAIYNKDFDNLRFIHATDLHIARRNDFISQFLKERTGEKSNMHKKHIKIPIKLKKSTLKRDFEFKREFQWHRFKDLRNAKYNFNYHLRKLISFVNDKNIDFLLLGGDLVDYVEPANFDADYKNNFHVLIEIFLGLNKGLNKSPFLVTDKEFINNQEILCPIFTIPGNHDYRKGHYSLKFGNIHKIFGISKKDIKNYEDTKDFSYIKAIYSKRRFLRDYFWNFNSNLNYKVTIGNYNIILFDTGRDSIADVHDLIRGAPSTRGLKDYQIKLLRAYIKLCKDEKIIVVMHTPPVSPNLSILKRRKYRKKLKLKHRKLKWSDFYEDNLRKKLENSRLDTLFNLKYETIMYNWPDLLRIFTGSDEVIKRKVDLILCGHTHTVKEFRLKEAKEVEAESLSIGYLITPIFVDVPCEVYTDKYRDYFNKFEDPMDLIIWFDVNKPFIFQTQALGPIDSRFRRFKPPGFRYFEVKNNEIVENSIYSLHLKEF